MSKTKPSLILYTRIKSRFSKSNHSNILLCQETLAIVTKSNGAVSYKNYLKKSFIDKLNAGSELFNNDLVSMTSKNMTSTVYSFGRDHGHFGRILNQTVISKPSLNLKNGTEFTGFCFTPQDGNSLLSSISIAEWFMYPNSYEEKIQCLKPYFFDEV